MCQRRFIVLILVVGLVVTACSSVVSTPAEAVSDPAPADTVEETTEEVAEPNTEQAAEAVEAKPLLIAIAVEKNHRSIVAPEFPLELAATFREGEGRLTGDLNIFYCEAEKESICLIEQARLEAPLIVSDRGDSTLQLDYSIELPEIPGQTS